MSVPQPHNKCGDGPDDEISITLTNSRKDGFDKVKERKAKRNEKKRSQKRSGNRRWRQRNNRRGNRSQQRSQQRDKK